MKTSIVDKSSFLIMNDRLYQAALDEFCSKQFDFASLNDILKKSDFNKGSFYYRFTDKFDLFQSLVSLLYTEFSSTLNRNVLALPDRFLPFSISTAFLDSIQSMVLQDSRQVQLLSRLELESSILLESLTFDSVMSPLQSLHLFLQRCNNIESSQNMESILAMTYRTLPTFLGHDFDELKLNSLIKQTYTLLSSTKGTSQVQIISDTLHKQGQQSSQKKPWQIDSMPNGSIHIVVGNDIQTTILSDNDIHTTEENLEVDAMSIVHHFGKLTVDSYFKSQVKHDFPKRELGRFSRLIGIEALLKSKLENLTISALSRVAILSQFLLHPSSVTLGEGLDFISPDDSLFICRFILNIKRNGGKITLYGAQMGFMLPYADTVSFAFQDRIVTSYNREELQRKYPSNRFFVTMSTPDGIIKKTLGKDKLDTVFAQPLPEGSELLGIQASSFDLFSMYHLETGVDLF